MDWIRGIRVGLILGFVPFSLRRLGPGDKLRLLRLGSRQVFGVRVLKGTVISLCLFGLASCASTISDVGLTVPAAIARGGYGVPLSVEDLTDGRRAFYWEMRDSMVIRSPAPTPADGVFSAPIPGSPKGAAKPLPECLYTLYGTWNAASAQWMVNSFRRPPITCVDA